jgi:hypothetical protein
MFIIKWRNRASKQISPVITGLSKYPTVEAVEKQIAAWKFLWPYNEYYVEPVASQSNDTDWWPDMNHCQICGQPSH